MRIKSTVVVLQPFFIIITYHSHISDHDHIGNASYSSNAIEEKVSPIAYSMHPTEERCASSPPDDVDKSRLTDIRSSYLKIANVHERTA